MRTRHFATSPGAISSGVASSLAMIAVALVVTTTTPLPARAADTASSFRFDIAGQTLSQALREYGQVAGVAIIFTEDLVAGRKASVLRGEYTAQAALEKLLEGTGLVAERSPSGAFMIRRSATSTPTGSTTPRLRSEVGAVGNSGLVRTDGRRPEEFVEIQEIVVTAQKRTERLQDVPVAVTAVSAEALEQAVINDTINLTKLTPSLTFTQGAHPQMSSFRIRGVGTAISGDIEPSVASIVDGVVMARTAQGFSDLADIERVEVLRGPQGTLFGKNAIGGVVNVVTKRPSKTFETNAKITVAEDEEYRVQGSLSGPITGTLGGRISGFYNDVGGNIRNVSLNKDVNGQESFGFRGKLEWEPIDALNVLLTVDYRDVDSLCCNSTLIRIDNPLLLQLAQPAQPGFNNRIDLDNALTRYETEQSLYSLEANLDLSAVTLTSITAYQEFSYFADLPNDRLNTPIPLYLPVTNGSVDLNGGPLDLDQFTQELRITSPGSERFNYLAGLYYLDFNLTRGFERRFGSCAPGGNPAQFGQFCVVPLYRSQAGFRAQQGTKHIAAFGQVDWRLVGGLSALAGVRVQREDISFNATRANVRVVASDLPLVGVGPSSGSGKSHDTVTTGKLGLKYEFTRDAQVYLTWANGYKAPTYELNFTAAYENQQPIEPETGKAWELGYKGRMWDQRLMVNTAVFYADFDNLQVQANRGNPDLGIFQLAPTNAGSTNIKGAEVEFSFHPVEMFTLSGGVTYLDMSVNIDRLQCPLQLQATAPTMSGTPINVCFRPTGSTTAMQNVRNGYLPMSSKWRGNLTARVEQAIGQTGVMGFGQVSANSQSRFGFAIEQDPLTEHPGYTLVDASIGVHDENDRYQVSVFVKNLFDKHYLTSIGHAATLTTATVTPGNLIGNVPKDANRYFGVTFGVSF